MACHVRSYAARAWNAGYSYLQPTFFVPRISPLRRRQPWSDAVLLIEHASEDGGNTGGSKTATTKASGEFGDGLAKPNEAPRHPSM